MYIMLAREEKLGCRIIQELYIFEIDTKTEVLEIISTFCDFGKEIVTNRWKLLQKLIEEAPDHEISIRAGKDVQYLCLTLRDWHSGDSEGSFGELGAGLKID